MAINAAYRFHSIRFTGAQFGGTLLLGGTTQGSVSNNPEVVQEFVDGLVFPSLVSIRSFAQDLQLTTTNIDDAINAMGTGTQCIDAGSTAELFFARLDPCAAGGAGIDVNPTHKKITIGSATEVGGTLIFQNLNTDHRGDALYSFQLVPRFDGTNLPLVITNNVALPVGVIDSKKRFTLGPDMTVSGHVIAGRKSVNVEGGVSLDRDAADSSIYDEYIGLQQAAQKMTVTGLMDDWFDLAKLGLASNATTHADTMFVLRQRDSNDPSGFKPRGDAEHVSITMSGKAVATSVAEWSGIDKATNAFEIYGEHDGTNAPLVALTGQTY